MESNAGAPSSIAGSVTGATVDDSLIWPSMQDLNTRLRRVITAYQRNYKKEEMKQQQKAKVNLSKYFYFHHVYQSKNYLSPLQKHSTKKSLLQDFFNNKISNTVLLKSEVIRGNRKRKKEKTKSPGTKTVHKTHTITHEILFRYRFSLYFVSNITERTFV